MENYLIAMATFACFYALMALGLDRNDVRRYAERYSWDRSTRQFVSHLVPARRTESFADAEAADGRSVAR